MQHAKLSQSIVAAMLQHRNKNIIGFRAGSASLLGLLKSDVAPSPEDIVMLQVWRGVASVKICGSEEGLIVGRRKIFCLNMLKNILKCRRIHIKDSENLNNP